MAGLFGGSGTPASRLLGAAPASNWSDRLSLLGAALQDAGANFEGNPGAAVNLARAKQGLLQTQVQQAARDAASPDPNIRQRAYATLAASGVDIAPFQKNAAAQATPALLDTMTNGRQMNGAESAKYQGMDGLPRLPVSGVGDALGAVGSPELSAEYAPVLLKQQIEAQQKASEPYTLTPGSARYVGDKMIANAPRLPDPNKPFNADGTPNKAFQDYQAGLIKARAAASGASDMAGWTILNDPETNTPYRYNVRTGSATTLNGQPYTPQGATHVQSGQTRSAQTAAVQRYMQEHPRATADDIMQFAADFGATGKSVGAFSTGKQGDLIRSFNVGISHLNTLGGLVDALGNGDIQAFNKVGNAYAQQTGNPAPTNFDAAKAIVGDEIIKAIVGGGGALADRENAQNQINRANSPQQLLGVINTYKNLMAGQLSGLKKQYSDTTHRGNFDSRLSPEAQAELERDQKQTPQNTPRTAPAGHIRVFNPATGRLE